MPGFESQGLYVGLTLQDKFTAGMQRAAQGVKGFASTAKSQLAAVGSAFRNVARVGTGFLRVLTSWRTLLAGFGAFRLVEFATSIEDVDRAFSNLMKSIGETGPDVLRRLREAVHGTISDLDLMAASNRAVLLGAAQTGDQLELLATLSRRLGKAMGLTAKQAFEDLSLAIGRQSRLILDNLGIIVRVEDANEAYARSLNKTTSQLNDAEKRQAFWNAVVEGAQRRIASLGEDVDTLGDAWQRFKARVSNIFTDILRATTPLFREGIESLDKWLEDATVRIFDLGIAAVQMLRRVFPEIQRLGESIASAFTPLTKIAQFLSDKSLVDVIDAIADAQRKLEKAAGAQITEMGGYGTGAMPMPRITKAGGEAAKKSDETYDAWIRRLIDGGFIAPSDAAVRELQRLLLEKRDIDRMVVLLAGGVPAEDPSGVRAQQDAWQQTLNAMVGMRDDFIRETAARQARQKLELDRAALERWQAAIGGTAQGIAEIGSGIEDVASSVGQIHPIMVELYGDTQRLKTGFDGVVDSLDQIRRAGTDTFQQISDLTMGIADSFATHFSNEIINAVKGTKTLKEAFKDMAAGILEDISRMLLRMAAFRLMAGLIGFGQEMFTSRMPEGWDAGAKYFQHGGVATTPTRAVIAEHAPEAVVPLHGGRSIPVTFTGGAGGSVVNNYYHVEATDVDSFRKLFRNAAASESDLIGNIHRRQYQGRPRLRRAYS